MRKSPSATPAKKGVVWIAVDLGGTQLRTAAFTKAGAMLVRRSIATPRLAGQETIILAVIDEIRAAAAAVGRTPQMVGVSTLGPVEPVTGLIHTAPTLHDFDQVPLGARLREALGVPVHVFNDANAAAIAEWRLGAGRGTQTFCYVTVSTGIGCGIIANGRLLTGHRGKAGEFGRLRIPIATGTRRLEEISSGTAIAAAACDILETDVYTSLRDLPGSRTLTAADVGAAANSGDPIAGQIFAGASETLGVQLANLTRMIDPEVIAVGGGVTLAGDPFWVPLRASFEACLAQDSITPPRLLAAGLQADVGLHGAFLGLQTLMFS